MLSPIWGGAYDAVLGKSEFDESEHPRQPAGSDKGGQFAPKAGGAMSDLAEQLRDLRTWYKSSGVRYRKFDDEFNAYKRQQAKILDAHGVTQEQYQEYLNPAPVELPSEVWHAGPLTDSKERGIFFSEQKAMADNFASIRGAPSEKYRARLENPLTAKNAREAIWWLDEKTAYKLQRDLFYGTSAKYIARDGTGRKSFFNTLWQQDLDRQVMKFAKARGYDGMIYTHSDSGDGLEVVAFDRGAIEKL